MRRETPFTLDEAKAYIIESINQWENTNKTDKIISMAGWAYNTRVKKAVVVTPAKRMDDLKKNIKDLDRMIKRNVDGGVKSNSGLEKELADAKAEHTKLLNLIVNKKLTDDAKKT